MCLIIFMYSLIKILFLFGSFAVKVWLPFLLSASLSYSSSPLLFLRHHSIFNTSICYSELMQLLLFSHQVVSDFTTPWTAALQASQSLTISQSLPKFMSNELMVQSNHLILCHPLFLLPSIFPSIRVFSSESALCIRWPKYWSFSISPSSEYSGLISFRIDWFDPFAVQGSLKRLLQHNSLKASILRCSAFFMVQLSQLYVNTKKIIGLTIWTFVSKVMSLFFNTLSKFVIAFLATSSGFMAAVTIHSEFRTQEEEICHCFHLFPLYLP